MRKKRTTPPPGEPTPTQKPAPGAAFLALEDHTPLEETAPVTPSAHLLSPAHQRFAQEYLSDLNGTRAYQRTYPDASLDSCRTEAARLLANPTIRNEVQRLLDERATITGITTDRVIVKLWETATADPRELVDVRVGSCRHCWGLYHQHQYTDIEWDRVQTEHVHREVKLRKLAEKQGTPFEPTPCPEKGGTGYSPNRAPNAECPECHGDGRPRAIIRDLRKASPGALSLYGGTKYDKDGRLTVIVRDQLPALKMVAEHLGLLNGLAREPEADPLLLLLEQIRGAHGAGSALPIVHDDPEAHAITDVVAKAPTKKAAPGAGSSPSSKKQWRPIR